MSEMSHMRTQENGGPRRSSMKAAQMGVIVGGSALAIFGITRRSALGAALAAAGGSIVLAAATRGRQSNSSARASILVNCSREEAFQFWRNFENLPRFMNRLENVSVLDNHRSRWRALGPGSKEITWEAEIIEERENEFIAWRSLPDSDIQVDGIVEFTEAPENRGTLISTQLEFSPWPGTNGKFARFLGKGASFAIRQDLRRLEALLETGEIPTIEGQPHGPRDRMTAVMRLADPTRPIRPGSDLKQVMETRRSIA